MLGKWKSFKPPLEVAVIVLLGLTPLLWFKEGLPINGADLEFPMRPVDNFFRRIYVWDDRRCAGWDQSAEYVPHLFPLYLASAFLARLGVSVMDIERLWFVFIFALPGLSMYYLVSSLVEPYGRREAALTSAILYMFNAYVLIFWHDGNQVLLFAYGMWPILLTLWMRGIEVRSRLGQLKTALLVALASLIMAPSASNLPAVIVTAIPFGLFVPYHLLGSEKRGRELIRILPFLLLTLVAWLLVNFWWIAPTLASAQRAGRPIFAEFHFSEQANFLEFLRLLGFWGWYSGHKGTPYFPFAGNYALDPTLVLATLLVPIIAVLGIVLGHGRERRTLFFAFLAVSGVFLAKSAHRPAGEVYTWLFHNFPGFWIFRNPYKRFLCLAVLGYAFLGGIAVRDLYRRFPHQRRRATVMGMILLVSVAAFVPSYPLLTGEVVEGQVGISVPAYYDELNSWLDQVHDDHRVFWFPTVEFPYVKHTWGYEGSDIRPHLISVPQVRGIRRATVLVPLYKHISELTKKGTTISYIGRIIGLLSAKYILVDGSVDWAYYNLDPPEYCEKVLGAQEGTDLVGEIGEILIFRNEWASPLVFAADGAFYVDGGVESIDSIVSSPEFESNVAIFLSDQLSPEERVTAQTIVGLVNSSEAPEISFEKVNPTRYEVSVSASAPFLLVCGEDFDRGWKAYVDGREAGQHLMVNGYANGWLLETTGEYEVTIEYEPQGLFDLAVNVSTVSVVAIMALLLFSRRFRQSAVTQIR